MISYHDCACGERIRRGVRQCSACEIAERANERIAALEARLAEAERERDEARRKAAELDVLLDAEKGEREQNRTAHIAQRALYRARLEGMTTRLHRIEQAAVEEIARLTRERDEAVDRATVLDFDREHARLRAIALDEICTALFGPGEYTVDEVRAAVPALVARTTAAEARVRELEEALRGLLLSRDASWTGGHDWQDAVDHAVDLLSPTAPAAGAERTAKALAADPHLHPNGRCACAGEGACEWCRQIEPTPTAPAPEEM